jgi:hypothetical protein
MQCLPGTAPAMLIDNRVVDDQAVHVAGWDQIVNGVSLIVKRFVRWEAEVAAQENAQIDAGFRCRGFKPREEEGVVRADKINGQISDGRASPDLRNGEIGRSVFVSRCSPHIHFFLFRCRLSVKRPIEGLMPGQAKTPNFFNGSRGWIGGWCSLLPRKYPDPYAETTRDRLSADRRSLTWKNRVSKSRV